MIATATVATRSRRGGIQAAFDVMSMEGRNVPVDKAADSWDNFSDDEQGYLLAAHQELFADRYNKDGEMIFS